MGSAFLTDMKHQFGFMFTPIFHRVDCRNMGKNCIKSSCKPQCAVTKQSKIEDIRLQIDKSYQIFGEKLDTVLCHTPDIISSDLKNIVLEAFEYIDNQYNFKKGLSIKTMCSISFKFNFD